MELNTSEAEVQIAGSRRWKLLFALSVIVSFCINLYQSHQVVSPLDHVGSDMRGYVERAWRLAVADPFTNYDTFFPPGTHFVFAILFRILGFAKGMRALVVIQAAMLAAANGMLGLTAAHLFRSWKSAALVTLFASLNLSFVFLSSFFMSEPLFILVFLLAQYFFIRAVQYRGAHFRFFVLGYLLAVGFLIRGQAICLAVPIGLFFVSKRGWPFWSFLPAMVVGFLPLIVLQIALNSSITGKFSPFLSSNDGWALYMAQSRHEAVGCLDVKGGYFYYFCNNNSFFESRFLPPVTLPTAVTDVEYFRNKTKELWRNDPLLQVIRGLKSVTELFTFEPRWPARNVMRLQKYDIACEWLLFVFGTVPAVFALVTAVRRGSYRWEAFFLVSPILMVAFMSFFYSGQPRYLVPFQYNWFLLAVPAYTRFAALFRTSDNSKSAYVA